ncbi:MAG TPA: hypothetical protein VMP11_13110 [Verrucomicrobiae bacterium]|nr:hypothetical protein [Verrucomicrobiae bacterium]
MIHGTGIQRAWHDNGRLQAEVSTMRGRFYGRNRLWLRDGSLLTDTYCLDGRDVSAETYRVAAVDDPHLPRFRGKPSATFPDGLTGQKHLHRVLVDGLLEKPNSREARAWLGKETRDKTTRLLGRFKRESDAVCFIEQLYRAGARKVIVPGIYASKIGDQFADGLIVKLPKDTAIRKAIRNVCAQLRKKRLGVVQPEADFGETSLYVSMA